MAGQRIFSLKANVTAAILAGGSSKRMGRDKALLKIGGLTIIERIICVISPIFKELIIVAKATEKLHYPGIKVVKDLNDFQNPIVGIYTALKAAKFSRCFVFACDMPFLNPELIRYMVSIHTGCDIIIPQDTSGEHPLHSIYSKRCLAAIKSRIHQKDFKVGDVLKLFKVRRLTNRILLELDPEQTALFNINTLPELILARRIQMKRRWLD